MARPKEFDPDAALDAALDVFWRQGYEATSVGDLVEHLGIGRASLYATFGSKHDLYLRALRRYVERRPDIVELLSQPGPVLPVLRTLVHSYVDEALCDQQRRGCMIANAASERTPHDPEVTRWVESSWRTMEVALASALTRARAQGELPADRDPQTLARFLLVTLQGLRLVGKADPDPERLRAAADVALAALE